MTNSHNRSGRNGSYAERFFNNHSPQQLNGSGSKRNNATNSNGGNVGRTPKSPNSTYFRSISISNAIPIVQQPTSPVSSKNGAYYSSTSPSGQHHSFNGQRSSPGGGGGPFNNSIGSYPGSLSGSPPNFSHFAGSKCYDAPAPTALPKPPVHWTSSASSNVTISSALHTSKSFTNKPTSASAVNARSAYNSKGPSSVVSSATVNTSRPKVKSVVKPAMSCAAAAAKANRRVDFTHNLKTALNVQA